MQCKSTDDLTNDLMSACSLDAFLSENRDQLREWHIPELLQQIIDVHGVKKATLARCSGMSEVYLHQILSGRRKPSRDRMLCLAFGLSAGPEETQTLLRRGGYACLYPRVKRDAIILYGLQSGMTLFAVNDRLFDAGEEPLL